MSGIIDFHHHWIPPHHAKNLQRVALPDQTVRELKPGTIGLFRDDSMLFWCNEQISSVDLLRKNLDVYGIEKALISVSNWIEWLDLSMCRELNDSMAELKANCGDTVLTLAHVPIGEDGYLDELERCASLGVSGVFTIVHIERMGWSLDHPELKKFYQAVSELGLPLIVHPACAPLEYGLDGTEGRLPLLDHDLLTCYGRPYNTTVSLLRLILSDILDGFPNLRIVYPHLGGSFGVMKERILSRYFDLGMRDSIERRLAQIWFDTAPPRWSEHELRCAIETLGKDRVVFGSDHPIAEDYLERAIDILKGPCLSDEERRLISRENATKYFGF